MEAIIDTNVLVYAAKQKIDLFGVLASKDYKIIIPTCITAELKSLSTGAEKGAEKRAAKLALQLIKHAKILAKNIGAGEADDLILNYAKNHAAAVITNDKLLKLKARSEGVKTVSVGQNSQLR